MPDVARHVLEIVVVVIAMLALVLIVQKLTAVEGVDEQGNVKGGMVTNKVNETITHVFDKTSDSFEQDKSEKE